jgi:hypothetical protein
MITPPQVYWASLATLVSETAPVGSMTTQFVPYDRGFREA